MKQYWETEKHQKLENIAFHMKARHLKYMMQDSSRNKKLRREFNGIVFDFCRQKLDETVLSDLIGLAREMRVPNKIQDMMIGEKINTTEGRAVLHTALRRPKDSRKVLVDAEDVVPNVHEVLDRIEGFADKIRSGELKGHTGKLLTDVVCIGIGGSYLGPEFVFEALKTYPEAEQQAKGRQTHFLANVDPIDVRRALSGFSPETTLVVVISKTFTTAETMLNAKTVRDWLVKGLKDEHAVAKHMCAVSTNIKGTSEFGINPDNVFGFWDWVGGRFSVCSAVGMLPLALQYGMPIVREFLSGCHEMDEHFKNAPLEENLPVLMGLLGVWNSTYLDYENVAILPYCQALHRFAPYVQQLVMESNGKRVTIDGAELPQAASEVYFGEPGTNGQHSFYQLLHQGRTIPADFIGFIRSQNPIKVTDISNHDELMSNFFAQPDALALGKSAEDCQDENVPKELVPHKVFPGDRPSSCLLMPICSPFNVGMLLALYEHRTAVQGFIWNINSFDQWGVELGKVLAKNIRQVLQDRRKGHNPRSEASNIPQPTRDLIDIYIKKGNN